MTTSRQYQRNWTLIWRCDVNIRLNNPLGMTSPKDVRITNMTLNMWKGYDDRGPILQKENIILYRIRFSDSPDPGRKLAYRYPNKKIIQGAPRLPLRNCHFGCLELFGCNCRFTPANVYAICHQSDREISGLFSREIIHMETLSGDESLV